MATTTEETSGSSAGTVQAGSGSSPASIHQGNSLKVFANRYPTLRATLKEIVQNGIDQGAGHIFVGVDLDKRVVVVLDDGKGTTKAGFDEALMNIANSIKDDDQLGEFGLGLVAPYDKCRTYTFNSVARGAKKGHTWTFQESKLRRQASLEIPWVSIRKLPAVPGQFKGDLSGHFGTRYQTMVKMTGLTKDRYVSAVDLEVLVSEIRQNFGMAMLRKGVEVRVVLIKDGDKEVRDIEPQPFQGDPLEVIEYTDPSAGRVSIELYRALQQSGTRNGKVQVMRQMGDFGVTMAAFANQARFGKSYWDFVRDAAEVLSSGFFEGCIRCENITLRDDRESYEYNEALHGLYAVLSTWYEEYGQVLFEDEQEDRARTRYQDLGHESLERLREQFPDADWQRFGSPSPDPDGKEKAVVETAGGDDGEKPGTRGGGGPGEDREPGGGQGVPKKPAKPRPDGPGETGGTQRATVRGSSQGLTFSYDEMQGNAHLWEFDISTGTLHLNIRHPDWVRLDETKGKHTPRNDRWIMHLQEWLALELLTLLAHFPSAAELETYRTLIDGKIKPTIDLHIVNKR